MPNNKNKKNGKRQGGAGMTLKAGQSVRAAVPRRIATRKTSGFTMRNLRSTPYGDDIVEVTGSEPLVAVANTAASADLFTNAVQVISPDLVGGTLAAIANRYAKYFFTELCFEYVPYQPNSTDGHGFAFAYSPDGLQHSASLDFSKSLRFQHSMMLPMTGFQTGPEHNTLRVRPNRQVYPWFFNENLETTAADQRQTQQGELYGFSDSSITNATTWGHIWLHYKCELCDLTPDQGFTLESRVAKEALKSLSLQELEEYWRQARSDEWDKVSLRSMRS